MFFSFAIYQQKNNPNLNKQLPACVCIVQYFHNCKTDFPYYVYQNFPKSPGIQKYSLSCSGVQSSLLHASPLLLYILNLVDNATVDSTIF